MTRGIEAFRGAAADYEAWFTTPLGAFIAEQQTAALLALLGQPAAAPPPAGSRVLDVGAGTGFAVRTLAGAGYRTAAIEPEPGMRARGVRSTPAATSGWLAAIGEHLPFRNATFDGVLFFTSLEFVADPSRCVAEALRVLRPHGRLAVGYLTSLSPWCSLYRDLADKGVPPWPEARFFSRERIEDLAGSAPAAEAAAVYLAPDAEPPYGEADAAGRRAGNRPALELLLFIRS